MGYDILEIYEVLHWPSNEQIDSSTGRGGLFTECINQHVSSHQDPSQWISGQCVHLEAETGVCEGIHIQ